MASPQISKERDQIRLNLDVSPEVDKLLGELAYKIGGTKSDVLLKGILLLKIAVAAKDEGKKIGIAEKDQPLAKEITGISST